ncbi:MAG: family 16 glycoside hydrolase [Gemmataceae bacterium]
MRRLLAFVLLSSPLPAADPPKPDKDGFVPLFNGKDLTGFMNLNCGPKTWSVKGGELITSGTPYGLLRTDKQYENFEAEFEWMHVNTKEVGNSGFFVWCDPLPQVGGPYTRGIEVQVLVNLTYTNKEGKVTASSHGDLFSVSGAKCKPDRPHPSGSERCLPSENRAKGGGEWNHYRVVANDGRITLAVNGKEVSGISDCTPRKGYLAFESEGAECHYRNIKIKELPTSNPKPEQVAKVDEGFKPLFNHTDLTGWESTPGAWKVADGVLKCTGQGELRMAEKHAKFELIFDWKGPAECQVKEYSTPTTAAGTTVKATKAGQWQRERTVVDFGAVAVSSAFVAADKLELRNIYLREIKDGK